jgi:HK97 family phage portal protein
MNSVKSVLKNLINSNKTTTKANYHSFMYNPSLPEWSPREYYKFADEAYNKNVIANRCINMIAQSAASVPWMLYKSEGDKKSEVKTHPLIKLLQQPSPIYGGSEFFENIFSYKLISGNAYILIINQDNQPPSELHLLRPDRVSVVAGSHLIPDGYYYEKENNEKIFYPINKITGRSKILHLRNFNPLDDYYGLSPIEAASYSIDQHNQAAIWNQSLLQNGARPSGSLIIKPDNLQNGNLSEIQYNRLKEQVDNCFTGAINTGRPMLLEGGMEWKEMSLTPKDMDFIESKNSAARDIALAFGVPPQLLGIPGDNTYSNMQEARLGLWEETILPMLDHIKDALNNWLIPMYANDLELAYNKDAISVLASRRETTWQRVENSSFMTINEKRSAVGLSPIDNGDIISN